jgi:hypothetical protein
MAHGAGRAWTPEEDHILMESRKRGESSKVIARRLDRTQRAVEAHYQVLRHSLGCMSPVSEADIAAADRLKNAILGLFARTANAFDESMSDAIARHLGPEPIKRPAGTENYYGTCSAERLAA